MTDATEGTDDGYGLTYPPDDTSYTVRQNLVDILQRELLGPVHGPDEVLPFSPRSHYLVGYIAPVKITTVAAAGADEEESDGQRGELAEARCDAEGLAASRGVPAFAADDDNGTDAADEDAEDRAPKQGLMIPASMGLRFQVPMDLASFTVTATWGTYEAVKTDQVTKAGRTVYHYQRTPIEFRRVITMADLRAGRTTTVPLRDAVCLRIDRYDDPGFGRALVEIALCNDQETPSPIPLGMWMFQTKLHVDAGGAEAFLPVCDVLEQGLPEHDDEVRLLNLQYRNRLEYAIGRTCSVNWTVRDDARRASAVETTWLPVTETPQTKARTVGGALLSMDALARVTPEQLRTGLQPLIAGYGSWLDEQNGIAAQLPAHLRVTAEEALHAARQAHARLQAGLDHVAGDAGALRCFRFMNQVMREQRIASQVAALRASDADLSIAAARAEVDARGAKASSWRPFQLAFIVMQLGALTDPTATDRSAKHLAEVELLFFPTGGGKTEAYLGLAAYTFAIRRRQGIVDSADGPLDGRDGVAVLMRYTLRLLTAQQFQRATALICAAELARRDDEQTWGTQPFRIGLWVGTDVSPKRFEEAEEQLTRANEYGAAYRLTVLQVQRCPWCGTPIHAAHVKADKTLRRVFVYCGDELADCPFAKGGTVPDGLPVLTVDEEIYRLTPAFVIATVDKFARLAREGEAAALFGYVGRRCARHGYVHPDYRPCDIKTSHPAANGYPAATVAPVGRLRPPDLIIQDELHLITGALGTSVGLFEVAVETLSSWERPDGKPVRPLIVASTATVRNAGEQVRGLYGRRVAMFPPQVLDVADTYFSTELPISPSTPGRRYLGVSAQGVRLSSTEIRVAEVLLSAGQLLFDRSGAAADPYMTLVGYFNATRELAGMARYMGDDVQSRVKSPRKDSGFPRRWGTAYGQLNTGELTARIASSKIGETLDQLGFPFDPDYDTTAASQDRLAAARRGEKVVSRKEGAAPFDAVLATSMLQVGVDVQRLGLMLVIGQPKNTAEYIQASSRVGRDEHKPGLVVALGNWARPRDLAHFEQFRHYHETFYAQVEALSVTPFSPTSLDRGIDGLLVSAVRVLQAHLDDGLSLEHNAGRITDNLEAIDRIVERLTARIQAAGGDEAVGRAGNLLINLVDQWTKRADYAKQGSQTLVYERVGTGSQSLPLLISPENTQVGVKSSAQAPFVVANSMREVQPEINVLVSPIKERLFARTPEGTPAWELPVSEDD